MQRMHPTFAQVLIGSGRYQNQEIVDILSCLHGQGRGDAFSQTTLDAVIEARIAAAPAIIPSR
jgi:hypothetical protein